MAIPKLRDDYILVRVVAIALNPTDWTTLDAPGKDGTIVGCDYAGIVEKVGKSVTKNFKKGDRVAGFGQGGMHIARGKRRRQYADQSYGQRCQPRERRIRSDNCR